MGQGRIDRLDRDAFISGIMVGECPRCGSQNTHDCQAPDFFINPDTGEIEKMGSECGIAREIDDITIGHCDDCDFVWCLECGQEIEMNNPVCSHWSVCEECGRTDEYPDECPNKEEVEAGDLLVNPCISSLQDPESVKQSIGTVINDENLRRELFNAVDEGLLLTECPQIEECSHCPYGGVLFRCPRIQDYSNLAQSG